MGSHNPSASSRQRRERWQRRAARRRAPSSGGVRHRQLAHSRHLTRRSPLQQPWRPSLVSLCCPSSGHGQAHGPWQRVIHSACRPRKPRRWRRCLLDLSPPVGSSPTGDAPRSSPCLLPHGARPPSRSLSLLRLSDLASRPYERPSHSHSARMEVPLHHEREAKLRLAQKAKVELEAVLAWEAELEL